MDSQIFFIFAWAITCLIDITLLIMLLADVLLVSSSQILSYSWTVWSMVIKNGLIFFFFRFNFYSCTIYLTYFRAFMQESANVFCLADIRLGLLFESYNLVGVFRAFGISILSRGKSKGPRLSSCLFLTSKSINFVFYR